MLGILAHGTPRPRCIVMKVLWETGSRHEAEVQSGHMGTTHGDTRQGGSKTEDRESYIMIRQI